MEYSVRQLMEMVRNGHSILDYEFEADVYSRGGAYRFHRRGDISNVLCVLNNNSDYEDTVRLKVTGLSEIGKLRLLYVVDKLLEEEKERTLDEALKETLTLKV